MPDGEAQDARPDFAVRKPADRFGGPDKTDHGKVHTTEMEAVRGREANYCARVRGAGEEHNPFTDP